MALLFDDREAQDRRAAILLQAADQISKNKIAQAELKLKQDETNPKVQASKLATTMALLGNTEAAERLMKYAQEGSVNLPIQSSQSYTPTVNPIPDYLGRMQNSVNSQTAGINPIGITGGSIKVGGANLKYGTPAMSEYDKANLDIAKNVATKQAQDKSQVEFGANSSLIGTKRLLQQFSRSRKELEAFDPEVGKTGVSGFIARKGAELGNILDQLPETKALKAVAEPIAYRMARDMEGGRTTDQDRSVFTKSFADALKNPDKTNERVAANAIVSYLDKGADPDKAAQMLAELNKSDVDVLRNIARNVYDEYPALRIKSLGLDPNEWEVVSGK